MRRRVSQSHSLSTSFGPRSASGIKSKSTSKSFKDHPVKQLYLPQGLVSYVLSLPSQILFAILGMLGLAHYARQIVRVRPRSPGTVMLRANKAESNGTANSSAGAATETATGTGTETEAGTEEGGQVDVDAWIMRNTPSLSGSYTPSWWLPNGHLQTFFIVAGDFTKADPVDYVRTLLRVPDGGTIALDITPPNHNELPDSAPTVVVNHGLTGSANESYVRNVLAWVIKPTNEGGLGGRGVVINFRGCGGTPVTSTQLYSAATSCDTNTALHYLRTAFPHSALHGIGFSLGASVMSRYLGEAGERSLLSSGCAVGCPWNVVELSHALEDGWFSSRIYSRALGLNLAKLFYRAYDANPKLWEDDPKVAHIVPEMTKLKKLGGKLRLRTVDEVLVRHVGGPHPPWPFESADAYYAYAGSHQLIHNVKVPLLGINAFDDPVVHGDALPVSEVAAGSHVHLAVTGGGGHLGWFDGPLFRKRRAADGEERTSRWVRRPIAEFLTAAVRDLPPRGVGAVPTKEESDGFTYVDAEERPTQTGALPAPVGWKVLQTGVPLHILEDEQGLQGL